MWVTSYEKLIYISRIWKKWLKQLKEDTFNLPHTSQGENHGAMSMIIISEFLGNKTRGAWMKEDLFYFLELK